MVSHVGSTDLTTVAVTAATVGTRPMSGGCCGDHHPTVTTMSRWPVYHHPMTATGPLSLFILRCRYIPRGCILRRNILLWLLLLVLSFLLPSSNHLPCFVCQNDVTLEERTGITFAIYTKPNNRKLRKRCRRPLSSWHCHGLVISSFITSSTRICYSCWLILHAE